MSKNIILDHGPLTKMYYAYGDGQAQPGDDEHIHGDPTKLANEQWGSFVPFDFISEGDSPAFLHLVDVGLNNLDHADYGRWGGRFVPSPENPYRYEDGPSSAEFNPITGESDVYYPQTRWLKAIQEDFAARADWFVKPFNEANHAPQITVKQGMEVSAKAGQKVLLTVEMKDPDKNEVALTAWPYLEAGTGSAEVILKGLQVKVSIPGDAKKGDKLHVVVKGTDAGLPALTRYQRVVISVI